MAVGPAGAAAVQAVLLASPVVLILFPLVGISLAVAPLVVAVLFGATALALLAFPPRVLSLVQGVAAVAAVALVGVGLVAAGFDTPGCGDPGTPARSPTPESWPS